MAQPKLPATKHWRFELDVERIGWLTIDTPKASVNTLSREAIADLEALVMRIEELVATDEVIGVVLLSAKASGFIAGADVSEFDQMADYSILPDALRRTHALMERIENLKVPVVAGIHGFCLGGGLGIAMMADLRFAASDSRFGIPAANLGIAYSTDNVRRLIALVGPSVAKDILFSARRLDAAEALSVGLISRVVPPGELAAAVQDYAATLAEKAPLSIRASKAIVNELSKPESAQDESVIAGWVKTCFDSADYAEGRKAFTEKRKPVFTGR